MNAADLPGNFPKTFGWIGLGAMGFPMAINLQKKSLNHSRMIVYDVDEGAMDRFIEATVNTENAVSKAASSKEVAEKSVSWSLSHQFKLYQMEFSWYCHLGLCHNHSPRRSDFGNIYSEIFRTFLTWLGNRRSCKGCIPITWERNTGCRRYLWEIIHWLV